MKVEIEYIGDEQESAKLYVRQGHRSLEELVEYIEKEKYKGKILYVKEGKEKYQLHCRHIFFIESVREYLLVHTECKVFQYKKKLYELESELPEYFVRISKSVILNLKQVEHYSPQLNGIMKAVLYNKKEVYISRKYLQIVRAKIWGGM